MEGHLSSTLQTTIDHDLLCSFLPAAYRNQCHYTLRARSVLNLGFGSKASLISAMVTGIIEILCTFVSVFTVDRFGKRVFFFLQGGIQMLISQVIQNLTITLLYVSWQTLNLSKIIICVVDRYWNHDWSQIRNGWNREHTKTS